MIGDEPEIPTTIRVRQWKLASQGEDTSRAGAPSRDASIERLSIAGPAVKPIGKRVPEIRTLGLMSGDGKLGAGHGPNEEVVLHFERCPLFATCCFPFPMIGKLKSRPNAKPIAKPMP